MNPSSNETSGLNLPPPVMAETFAANPEGLVVSAPEMATSPAGTAPAANPLLPPINLPVPSAPLPTLATSAVTNTASNANPGVADDSDLIEKEWVQKAKEIIKNSQNDPHVQSKELNIFKADYMQKRYNKVLKLSE